MARQLIHCQNIMVTPQVHPDGWLADAWLVIAEGKIAGISIEQPEARLGDEVVFAQGAAVIPALLNGHTHLSQTMMRGLAGGRPLLRWLKEMIWPLQGAMSEEVLELAALLGLAENIRSGAGRVVDHQKITRTPAFSQAVLRAAKRSGLRFTLARAWSDRGNGAEDGKAVLEELENLLDAVKAEALLRVASGPLTPWRASAQTLKAAHWLAAAHDSFTHIHVSETEEEVDMSLKEYGLRPVAWLDSLGILDARCQVVHAVWVDEAEVDLLAARRAPVVHCPVSNAVLGSGIAPVAFMMKKGVRILLGTDGPASNDTQDCFETMKMTICLARASGLDASAVPARAALEMAVASRGLALGQPADLAFVSLNSVWSAPVHDLDSALALCARAGDTDYLMVAGEWLMRDRRITTLDEENILRESAAAVKSLRRQAGLDQ